MPTTSMNGPLALLVPKCLPSASSLDQNFLAMVSLMMATGGAFSLSASENLRPRSEEHTSELQSRLHLVCRLLLEKKKKSHADQYILKLTTKDYYSSQYRCHHTYIR